MKFFRVFKIAALVVLVFSASRMYSQANAQCANATPFCTGIPQTYPAANGAPPAQNGPCYGCLGSQPNPAWFFMQMSTSGPVSIAISANFDVDFICWGPFTSLTNVCGQLCGNIQSCSFSASPTETCTIANAVAGAFYMLLITNFSNQVQNINFNQTNGNTQGAGTTNCGLVCVTNLTNSGAICSGQSNLLTATTNSSVNSYTLFGPGGIISTGGLSNVNNTITATVPSLTSSAVYTMAASTGTSSCQALTTVTVIPYPTFSITPANPQICQGGHFNACVAFASPAANPANYSYSWSANLVSGSFATASPGTGIYAVASQCTPIYPSQISGTSAQINYSVTVTPNALSCPSTQTMQLTINNPLTPTLNLPPPLCSSVTPVQLQATPGGGTWTSPNGSPVVLGNGIFNPAAATTSDNPVLYSINVGSCVVSSTGTIQVAHYNPALLTSSVTTFCSTLDPVYDLMGIVQNTAGAWSGISVFNNSFNPSNLPTSVYTLTYSIPSTPPVLANVCPSYTTLNVPVYHPPTPVIATQPTLCNNSGTFQLVASPLTPGGLWTSSSNAVAALTGVLSPTTIATANTYTVTYTAGQGTCTAESAPASFVIAQFHTAALTGTINQLCSNSSSINLQLITQSPLGYWTGINTDSVTNTFNPSSPIPLTTGIYTLTYTNPSTPAAYASLCPDTRTIAVSVLNPPSAVISAAGPFCNKQGAVQLTVTPNTGTWTPSPYLTAGGLFTPSLSPVGNNLVQYVIGTSTCNTQQTASISVEGFVPSTIMTAIPDQCTTNSPLNLLPLTLSTSGSWTGPGVQGSNFNPALSGVGQVVIAYHTASSPSGLCPDQSTVAVNVFSLATPIINPMGPFCTSAMPIMLNVSPVGGVFGGANTSAVDAAGLFVPAAGRIGSNIVNYSITAGPCVAYAQTTISVEQFVPADFVASAGPYCKNDAHLTRNLNEIVYNAGGQWTGSGVNANGVFTFAQAAVGSNIVFHSTHSMPTATLCPDTKTTEIVVYDTPTVSIIPSTAMQGCTPFDFKINASTNNGKGEWIFSDGTSAINDLNADHIFRSPGTYNVVFNYSLFVSSDLACAAQRTLGPIKVFETPQPDFLAPEEIMLSEPSVQLTNIGAKVDRFRYEWTFTGNGLNQTSNEIDPQIVLPNAGDYKITLSATSLNNCKGEMIRIVTVKPEFHVFVPNSFTPNGDGHNDYFNPVFTDYGLDERAYELEIFDRWGTLVFHTKDKSQGWDGRKSGDTLKPDVYIYKLRYKDANGTVYTTTGNVTLLR